MRIAIGSQVYTSDGVYAGRVDRVVIDPATGHPTDIVVFRDGGSLDHEVVAPLSSVKASQASRLTLTVTLLEADGFPDYVEADYVSPTSAWPLRSGFSHADVLFPVVRLLEPTNQGGIGVGMGVEATDGPVGVIEEVRLDPSNSSVSSFVFRGLHRLDERFIVPINWVFGIRGRWVMLDCNSSQIHELAESPRAA